MGYERKLITHCIYWSRRADLNRRPTDYESVALPTELRRLLIDNSVVQNVIMFLTYMINLVQKGINPHSLGTPKL